MGTGRGSLGGKSEHPYRRFGMLPKTHGEGSISPYQFPFRRQLRFLVRREVRQVGHVLLTRMVTIRVFDLQHDSLIRWKT